MAPYNFKRFTFQFATPTNSMVSKLSRSRIIATVDSFKAKLSKFRASEPLPHAEISDAMEELSPDTPIDEKHILEFAETSGLRHQSPRAFTQYGSIKTRNELDTVHLLDVAAINAYSHDPPETSRIEGIDHSICVSASVVRLPMLITEHPAMHIVPISANIGVWEIEEGMEPFCRSP